MFKKRIGFQPFQTSTGKLVTYIGAVNQLQESISAIPLKPKIFFTKGTFLFTHELGIRLRVLGLRLPWFGSSKVVLLLVPPA